MTSPVNNNGLVLTTFMTPQNISTTRSRTAMRSKLNYTAENVRLDLRGAEPQNAIRTNVVVRNLAAEQEYKEFIGANPDVVRCTLVCVRQIPLIVANRAPKGKGP